MKNKLWILFTVLLQIVETAAAQDAMAVLQAAAAAMGTTNLRSIQYSGKGWKGAEGQSYYPGDDWPKFDLKSYTRTIDYDSKSSKEEYIRVQGNNSRRGGGGLPIQGEQRQVMMVSGNHAWTMQGNNPNPTPALAEQQQLEIWLTPHGFIKAAMAGNPTTISRTDFTLQINGNFKATEMGKTVKAIAFTALGKYRVTGEINDQNLVQHVRTSIPDPVLGDNVIETFYTDYRDFGGVKFPTTVHHHRGNFRVHPGSRYLNAFDLDVSHVQPNVNGVALSVPAPVRQATVAPVRVESQKMADGVWYLGGGSHNSVAVEFRDFIAIVEAPLNEQRSLAVIEEVKRIIPRKPIRYVVNTHHHFDHLGGLRTYVAEGAVVITHYQNREFYEQTVFGLRPWTLAPDRLSVYPIEATIETVTEKYLLSDGERIMELHPVRDFDHAATMLMAYLPKEKIVVEADLYDPPAPDISSQVAPTVDNMAFYDNVRRLKLDISQIVPIHGRVVPMAEFLKVVGKSQ